MEAPMKSICFLLFLCTIAMIFGAEEVAGEAQDFKHCFCSIPITDKYAKVTPECCNGMKKLMSTSDICSLAFSDEAQTAGVNPEASLPIPLRCNFVNRRVGYKCGAYTFP